MANIIGLSVPAYPSGKCIVVLDYHEFLFLFLKVCPNESLPLGSCGPRGCIIGLSIPAYPSGKCIAVVG